MQLYGKQFRDATLKPKNFKAVMAGGVGLHFTGRQKSKELCLLNKAPDDSHISQIFDRILPGCLHDTREMFQRSMIDQAMKTLKSNLSLTNMPVSISPGSQDGLGIIEMK